MTAMPYTGEWSSTGNIERIVYAVQMEKEKGKR